MTFFDNCDQGYAPHCCTATYEPNGFFHVGEVECCSVLWCEECTDVDERLMRERADAAIAMLKASIGQQPEAK